MNSSSGGLLVIANGSSPESLPASPAAPMRYGESLRASASDSTMDSRSGAPNHSTPLADRAPSWLFSTTRRRPRRAVRLPRHSDRSSSVTPTRPSSRMIISSRLMSPSSMTITMCGWSGGGGALRVNRCRSRRFSSSIASISASEFAIMRRWPMPSMSVGCCACGSHFAHSHSCFVRPALTTAISRSSGAWKVTSWAMRARARSRRSSMSPSRPTAANPRSAMEIGRSGTSEWARTNRRRASVAIGSSSSTGPVCGGTRRVARRCEPRPARRWQKSGSF